MSFFATITAFLGQPFLSRLGICRDKLQLGLSIFNNTDECMDFERSLVQLSRIDLGTVHAAAKAESLSKIYNTRIVLTCLIIGLLDQFWNLCFESQPPKQLK
jgi:hypothetical protein